MTSVSFFDGIAYFFLLVMGIIGFQRGVVEEMGRLLGLILANVVALRYVNVFTVHLENVLPEVQIPVQPLGYVLLFSLTLITVRLLTRFVHLLLLTKSTRWANRWMGLGFGVLKGLLILMVVVTAMEMLPGARWSQKILASSLMSQTLRETRTRITTLFNWPDFVKEGKNFMDQVIETPVEAED